MTHKRSVKQWMDPSGGWGQSGGYKMPRSRKTAENREKGNRLPPEGSLP